MLGFMQAEQTRPSSEASLQGHGKMERFNQKTVFEIKAMRSGALGPGIEVEFITAFPTREIDKPSQHFTAKAATARRLFRDQVVDVEEFTPHEVFEDAEAGAADTLTLILKIGKAIAGLLLTFDAGQE